MSKQQVTEQAVVRCVPRLRFPEFRGAEGWAQMRLIDTTDRSIKWSFIGGPFGSNLKSSDYVPYGVRIIQLQNIGDGEFCNEYKIFTTLEKANELLSNNIYPNDIIMSKMGDPVGRACLIPDDHDRYVMCSDGIRLVVDEKKNDKYFIYSLINSPLFRGAVDKTATGSTRKRIGLEELKNLPLWLPKKSEQQRIAACLSSLDDLINAESQQLTSLKTHKKGLMQQLFPREGESVPRMRLPDFRNNGEWNIFPLAALAEKIMVGIASAATHAYRETGVPMLRNQNIKEGGVDDSSLLFIDPTYEATHKNKRLKAGDVITVRTGYPGLSAVITNRYENAQCFTSLITRPKSDLLDSNYLCLYINSPIGKKFMLGAEAGGAQKNVNAGTLETLEVYLPQIEEQRKIASVFSNLDDLITAQAAYLDTLKQHKKGLMQQLFPSLDDRST
jgi:type I restriction enzyme S subunit